MGVDHSSAGNVGLNSVHHRPPPSNGEVTIVELGLDDVALVAEAGTVAALWRLETRRTEWTDLTLFGLIDHQRGLLGWSALVDGRPYVAFVRGVNDVQLSRLARWGVRSHGPDREPVPAARPLFSK